MRSARHCVHQPRQYSTEQYVPTSATGGQDLPRLPVCPSHLCVVAHPPVLCIYGSIFYRLTIDASCISCAWLMGLYALALVCACHQTWMTRCQAGSSRCATTILSLNFPVERQPLAKTGWDKHTKTVSKPDRFLRTLVSSQGNTVIDAQMGIMVGGGRDTIVRGNNFINCDKGLHIDSRGMGERTLSLLPTFFWNRQSAKTVC